MTLTRPLPQQELRDSRPRRRGSRGRTAAALLSVIAGGALSLAFDPVGASLLGPVSIAAFTVAVCLFADTARGGAVLGYLFGFAFLAAHVWWLKDSIGPGAWAAVTFVESLWFAAMGALIPLLRRLPAWPVLVAVMWSSVEVVRQMWPFGGFPWGQVGFTTVDTPVSAALPYVGVTGAGFIIALLATAVAYGVVAGRCNPRRAVLYLAAPLAMTVVPQLVPVDVARTGSVTVAVVQGDVPGSGDDVAGNHRQITRDHARATVDLARQVESGTAPRPDLVVWPENSTAVDPIRDLEANTEISMAATAIQTPLLVGGIVDGPRPGTALNQGILWTESGPDGQAYTKQHPVPFGEFIPFRSLLDGLSPRLAEIPRDMLPGAEAEPLDIDTEEGIVRIADAICFDVAYADPIAQQVRSGAELVVVQTSNAMFTGTSQREQQFTMSRARALETGRTVIVASLNGISGIITADGEVLARLEERTTDTMLEEVATSRAATPALRLMPVIDASLLGVAAIGAIWALIASSMGRLRARPDR
ncbi:apolipoprotein N-acyltransferase [Nocardioides salarius]|uniref:apolipoprotein N-acyltransferase n=1 Tax=Nocardioides salarius TaxID=374513 RepID=UPI001D0CEA26|nr:apolipoprotein N-acyltransferase [Nocardioides salarius]